MLPPTVMAGVLTPIPGDNDETVFLGASTGQSDDPLEGDTTGLPGIAGASVATQAISRPGATGPLQISQQFSSRYIIVRLLGIGGMGAVYQAWDAELGVMVALKVIRPEVTRDPTAAREIERRFKQELLLARQVTHKNVVRIHDLGEIDGIKYITMPYIEGEDLASVLRESGALPVVKVIPIARQIAAGLQAAHEAGVVHRDLKPANVMLEKDNHATIMDFGIARTAAHAETQISGAVDLNQVQTRLDDTVTRAAATVAGAVIGTIEYMAPEQARGQDVDQRTDIYAFGLMLYDMLVGRRRTDQAGGALAELQNRLRNGAPSVRAAVPTVPEPFDQVIARCVEAEPAKRYQSSTDLVAALDALDDRGELKPIKRVIGVPMMAAIVLLLLALSVGTWYYTRQQAPPVEHEPVSVVIADVQNTTGDPSFNRTLEPVLKLALEEATFITASDRAQIRRERGIQPPEVFDGQVARALAVQQGLGVVLAGTVQREARGYTLSVTATEAVTGNVITSVKDTVARKDQVLVAVTRLAENVREALGGERSDSAQRFAMDRLSATSLDAVHAYALAIEASTDSKFDQARQHFSDAVTLDPNFGLSYAGMGMMLRNLGQPEEAEKYAREALTHLDGMTERERFRTRGIFYTITGDYTACVKEYGDLIARYASDAAAHSNRALCLTYLRDVKGALQEMQRVVAILPRRALYRVNLGLYLAYASDFKLAAEEAQRAIDLGSPLGLLPLAFAQLADGQVAMSAASYETLANAGGIGASFATSGLADLAVYEGRYADADRLLQQGAAADLAGNDPDRAASKFAALAHARLAHGRQTAAAEAARRALENSRAVKVRFLAALVFVEVGAVKEAASVISGLASELQEEPQAYAGILQGETLLKAGDARGAIKAITAANDRLDTWIGRFALGRAYLAAGEFIQADSEFDRCVARRGEALALFLDEEPTYGFFPDVYYYKGRVREELKSRGFADSYRTYLSIREKAGEDPRLGEVRRRINN